MTGNTASDSAERVRALRAHYGLSQRELAELLDVSRVTVANWERGYNMSRLARYALYYLDYKLSTDAREWPHDHVNVSIGPEATP